MNLPINIGNDNDASSFKKPQQPRSLNSKVITLWKLFWAFWVFVVFYFLSVEFNLLYLFGDSPSLDRLQRPSLEQASVIYTSDSVLVGKYFKKNRSPVRYDQISPILINSLLATEDIRFHHHNGIDPEALISIVASTVMGDGRGGSTITQQLAKNLYKTRTSSSKGAIGYIPGLKTLIAKTKEWITAVKLEKTYTKEEIITLYLNTVDFGNNCFGIKTAAHNYFNTTPAKLTPDQAALLIGMLKGTTLYNPRRNYTRALQRRNTVMAQMVKYGFLEKAAFDTLKKKTITVWFREESHPDGVLDYYGNYLTEELKEWMEQNPRYDIYSDGLKIYLTINNKMQNHAKAAVAEHMAVLQTRFDNHWKDRNPWIDDKGNEIPNFLENMIRRTGGYRALKFKYRQKPDSLKAALYKPKDIKVFTWAQPEGVIKNLSPIDSLAHYKKILRSGLMSMDPYSGKIKAWVGGINFNFFQYDHVRMMRRQPGSTFKAFVYAAAMDNGYGPCSKIMDERRTYKYTETINGVTRDTSWTPKNATGTFSGMEITLRYAIGRSINSVAARVTDLLGAGVVAQYAKKMGIRDTLMALPSIGLGSNDVSLFDMVGAYSVFLNHGMWTEPHLIARIEDHNGKILKEFTPKRSKALSEEAAWLMVHMLKGTLQEPGGTAQALFQYNIFRGNEIAGKTGTSSNQSDGWFIGFTKDLCTGVWVGAEERSIHFRTLSMGEGSKTALPIFGKYMEKLYQDPKVAIKPGYLPKPWVNISKKYNCPTRLPKRDTVNIDDPSQNPEHPENLPDNIEQIPT